MPPKKGVPAVPPKRNSSKLIREGLAIPGEYTPQQQAERAARVAAEQAEAATAGSSSNASQPRKVSNVAPQPASGIDENPRQPSERKIPSRPTSSKPVSKESSVPTTSTTANTPNKFGYKPPPSIAKPSTALGDRQVSVPANKSPASKGLPTPRSGAALNNRRSTPAPLTKKAGESPISTPLTSAPLQPIHTPGFGYMNSTASSNSHRKSEPSASQEKSGHEVPKTTDSPEKRLSLHEVPSPIEGFLQIDVADHGRRTRHGVVLGNRPLQRDEDNDDNRSDSSGSSSSFVDSPIDRSKQEDAYRHLIASASAKIPEEELGPKGNKEDDQSTTFEHSSLFVLSPPIGPAPVEALPALPTSFNPLLGPFSDTAPAHSIASPLTSEEGDFDERSLAVDLDEELYDALGITALDFQSQTQSEIEESVSPNTSTPPTPPAQHESKIAGLLTNPWWSLIRNASVTPNTQSQTESEIEEPETRNTSVSPTPEPASEIDILSHSAPAGEFATPSYSAENSARERVLVQGQRRPGQGHVPLHDLEERHYMPQEMADFESWALDPDNADKPGVRKAAQALRVMRSKFFLTASELRYYNAVHEASTDWTVGALNEMKKKHEDETKSREGEIKKLRDQLCEVVEAAGSISGLFDGTIDDLAAESAGKITPLECDNLWKPEREVMSLDIEDLKHRLTDADFAKSLLETAHTKEVEELQQKLKAFEDDARVNEEEQENLSRELQSAKLELDLGSTASRDQLAATEKERDSLQRQLKDRNQDVENLSKKKASAEANEKAATELLNLANQNHAQIANALQGQIDILTGKKNEVEVAFSDLQNKLAGLTRAHTEIQDIIKDLKAKQEQINKNDKTLSKLRGEKQHVEDENKQLKTQLDFLAEKGPQMITHTECDNKYSGSIAESEKLKTRIHVALGAIEDITRDANKSVRDAKTSPTSTSPKDFHAHTLEEAIAKLAEVVVRDRKEGHKDIIELRKQSVAIDLFENDEKRAMEEEISRHKVEIKKLKAENERIKGEYDVLKSSGGEQAHEILRLKDQIAGLRFQLAEKEKELENSSTGRTAVSSLLDETITGLRTQLAEKEKALKDITARAAEPLKLNNTIAGLRAQLAEKERELQDSITKATAKSFELHEIITENSRKYNEEKARLASELSEAVKKKEDNDRAIDSLESKIHAQLAEKEKELQDSITEATELNATIAENSRAYDDEKAILASDLAEAIEKEESDLALASLENNIGGAFGFGQNPLELEITELKQKIVDLQREIEALTAKENRKPRNGAREGKRDKDFHTRASFGLAITDVELHLASMRITRAFNGTTRDDHEPAIAAAQEAVTISEQLRDEALIAQSSFWLAVVQWYAGNTEDAGQLLGFIEQTLLPRRERQYVKEYIQTCEDALACPMEAAGYAKGLERSRSGSISSDDSQAEGRHRR